MAMINTSDETRGKVRRSKASTHIDMTPMVDLAFLLLTFFMLTTSFFKPYTMQVDMPEKVENPIQQRPVQADKVLTLVLGENNKIYSYVGLPKPPLQVTDYSTKGVRKLLREKNASVKGLYVLIKPSVKAKYQNIVDVLDEMSIAAVPHYAIVKITDEDTQLMNGVIH
ncbi:ExbD/TolR family protein [Chryseolinea lacunae]|uniref:Biopolymer transporter ExbD n=1 Tax=Chryseolinea lacunae TaxID=2801331 RepID=A0ABS1KLJ5_9BACT|nr:biopolymer transporter ExbD [Chryseolinea lacunae]MBL0740334.1 biopolymer transporter ExbD [Chryseolinea lacunae]